MTRKQFLQSALGACAGILGISMLGCETTTPRTDGAIDTTLGNNGGGGGGGAGGGGQSADASTGGNETFDAGPSGGGEPLDAAMPSGRCVNNGTVTTIATNHGHVLVVSAADVAAGIEKAYDIRGTSTHTHTVTLTREHFAQLAQDHAITTTSTFDAGHSHGILVACA